VSTVGSVYPERGRNAWVVAQRPPRPAEPDPSVPHGVLLERERMASGELVDSGVVLLTNRECPWKCVMCDLWKHTTRATVPAGAIPGQIDVALRQWSAAGVRPSQVKLYNSGSFFDSAAIPPSDYPAIAGRLGFARHVVVESHPLLIGDRTREFRDRLGGTLEVAMGLETAQPEVLARLNKQFDLAQFSAATKRLRDDGVALRAFVLVNPPFQEPGTGVEWAVKSAAFAFDCGAAAVTLIPTRPGNGALERLHAAGEFAPPTLKMLEMAQAEALALGRGRVFADTWALEPFASCPHCFKARRERLAGINLAQQNSAPVRCSACDAR
jgi:radical SAM enzyme (TIGR01210 family)